MLTSVANDFQGRIMFLAKQKSWLTSHEEVAKNATLARTEVLLLWHSLFINTLNPFITHIGYSTK